MRVLRALRAHSTLLGVWLVLGAHVGHADDLADFNTAIEGAQAHQRVAVGYLRTGSTDLAALELDHLDQAWRAVVDRFAPKRPEAFADNPLYVTTFTSISTRLVMARILLGSGRQDGARDTLQGMRGELSALRRASNVTVLADCILDANKAMDALLAYKEAPPDWTRAETGTDVAAKAEVYARELARCDRMAGAPVHTDPEFRRLIDGALTSLALVPKAIETRDSDLLHRILIELRSFDNLLAFRFG